MKRVRLHTDSDVRAAAVALARYAVDADGRRERKTGDPVHDWITENRRAQYERALAAGQAWAVEMSKRGSYSSCGDLAHWLLLCLGCRDERLVNRSDDGGKTPWRVQVNISRIQSHPAYVRATASAGRPGLGDICHVLGNAPGSDHVFGLIRWLAAAVTGAHYGAPHGELRTEALHTLGGLHRIGQRRLVGWLDVTRVEYAETAVVPDGCEVGTEDDSPYPEGLSWEPE